MNENSKQQMDGKDLVNNQIALSAGGEIAKLLQANAQLTVVLAQTQQERDQLKKDNEDLKKQLKPTDEVVSAPADGSED
ncbi:hypothetical protein MUDAN_BIHEEGNE_03170 [Lactiplantibacillus mudanjiangensis]|uniref:hypothetical protein n=1 Tax=Lactiplantibacillus mudanjiangensis TaxID=1296538 RepID=UPI001015BD32|nr:hypothetical protein MUDAN_BIHEEGNE_03170 [Lactiplantibacillus mudanjiangensis]